MSRLWSSTKEENEAPPPSRPALRVIRLHGEIGRQLGSEKSGETDPKNEDILFSMNSFGLGLIFYPRVGQFLSRNRSIVPVYAFEKT